MGTSTWENENVWDAASNSYVNKWTNNTTLVPDAQRALDSQLTLMGDRSELAEGMMGRVESDFNDPMDYSQFQAQQSVSTDPESYRQESEDALYGKLTSRLDPFWEQQQGDMESQLASQGLTPGTEAYNRAYSNMNNSRTDAYGQAGMDSVIHGGSEAQRMQNMDINSAGFNNTLRQSQIAEESGKRRNTLNEMNALLTGQQVSTPQMPGFVSAGKAAATDYTGAAEAQGNYNLDQFSIEQGGLNSTMGGIASLAGSAALMFSDRRLKTNIRRVGVLASGLAVYTYTYLWGVASVGVMADEAELLFPDSVLTHPSGFRMVNYGEIS
jgi:hypothetical protein